MLWSLARRVNVLLAAVSGVALVATGPFAEESLMVEAPAALAAEPRQQHYILAQTGVRRAKTAGGLTEVLPGRRAGMHWIRAALGTVMVLFAALSYMDLSIGAGVVVPTWPKVQGKLAHEPAVDGQAWTALGGVARAVDAACVAEAAAADKTSTASEKADEMCQSTQREPSQVLGRSPVKSMPRPVALPTVREAKPEASSTKGLWPQEAVPAPGDFQRMFRETRRAFEDAEMELRQEELREASLRQLDELRALTQEEAEERDSRRAARQAPRPVGVGFWQ